jgi:dihydroorotate dehydrogenase electron transfer subunit
MTAPMIPSAAARIVENRRIAPKGFIMSLALPHRDPPPRPGQFGHLRVDPSATFPFLRRPFSLWDWRPGEEGSQVDILYTVRGEGTRVMAAKRPGETVDFLGPLGNSFEVAPSTRRVLMIAGGAGIVPFHLFARRLNGTRATLLFGARTRDELYALEDLRRLPLEIETCTEDGSHGLRGRVTDLLEAHFEREGADGVSAYGCGPHAMLRAVARICRLRSVPCTLSLEVRMGCALGACRACVVPVRRGSDDWRFSRVCCEGPNYDIAELILE